MIITIQLHRLSIPRPQRIPPTPELSPSHSTSHTSRSY